MKHNGRNIITSDDVTLIGLNAGKTLNSVLEDLQDTQEKLRSNVKWLYKYGGVGGSSGGGGTITSWSVIFTLDDVRIPEQTEANPEAKTIIFKDKGQKRLYIHINNPGGDTYNIICTYNNGNSRISSTLDQSNRWTYSTVVPLNVNGDMTLSIVNGNEEEKRFSANYIVNAYDIEAVLVNNDGNKLQYTYDEDGNKQYNLIINNIKDNGLRFQLIYTAYVDLNISYSYKQIDSESIESGDTKMIKGLQNQILLDIPVLKDSELDDSLAGQYLFESSIFTEDVRENFDLRIELIPSELYLRIVPQDSSVKIYKTSDEEDPEYYQIGNRTFLVTPFNIAEGGTSVTVSYMIDDIPVVDNQGNVINTVVSQGKTTIQSLIFSTEGVHKITFIGKSGDVQKEFIYYIFTKLPSATIDWFFDENQVSSAYYRYGQAPGRVKLLLNNSVIDQNRYIIKNSNDINNDVIKINTNQELGNQEFLINIGIQYNYINDVSNEILSITDNNDNHADFFFHLYQNKVLIGQSGIGGQRFFIETQSKYDVTNNNKYHLLTFARKFIRKDITDLYEISIYFDGILQGTYTQFVSANGLNCYNTINLFNQNYSINLVDFSYFNNGYLNDAKVVKYWYAYQNKIQGNIENIEYKNTLIEEFQSAQLEKNDNFLNSHVFFSYDGLVNMIKKIKVPLMCFEYNPASNIDSGGNQINFFDWSDRRYDANSKDSIKLSVDLKWSNGSGTDSTQFQNISTVNIPTPDDHTINTRFTIDIQGSTTRTYKSKNYLLTLENISPEYDNVLPIFTPKFDINDKNSFLPENSFTLKADIVDSSHTNNTCVGKFVNDITQKFQDAKQIQSIYSDHIKNCLEGFPFLLFVHTINDDKYYYLGIYNFNLGRTSNFNLGYCDLRALGTEVVNSNDFQIYTVFSNSSGSNIGAELKSSIVTAEINDNESHYDFSQFDKTVLFQLPGLPNDSLHMFDDILPYDNDDIRNKIQKFVQRTAYAGGYIFDKLGKGFHDDISKNYTSEIGCVPNAHVQYVKSIENSQYKFTKINQPDLIFQHTDLVNMLSTHTEDGNPNQAPYCNYNSIVEYYTICMALGLLDSVEKNLNIKSWNNGNTFYLAFYDMDTCLGINNDGNNVNYFAFSDYWEDTNTESDETSYDFKLNTVRIYRDYQPSVSTKDYFDVPSSYIFAIAKYAKAVVQWLGLGDASQYKTPQDLWYSWRTINGPLRSAQYFVDTYYNGYMSGIDELMFNYNYRAKYYKENTSSASGQGGYVDDELKRFNGRSVEYTKDWLDKRLRILDAYFNLAGNKIIQIDDGKNYNDTSITVYEPYPEGNTTPLSSDVYIRSSILGDSTSFSNNIDLIIEAPSHTPLIITRSDNVSNYLIKEANKKYKLHIDNTGTTKIVFGGSTMWTYLDSINSFANGSLQISSDKLTFLNGTEGTISSWDLNMPALKEVYLHSKDYSGNLSFEALGGVDNYQNLNEIDISGSSINLTVDKENVRTINLSDITSNSIRILNCNNIKDLFFSNSKITNCEINPVTFIDNNTNVILEGKNYNNTLYLNGNFIKNLTLYSNNNSKLYIKSDKDLEYLNVQGFSEVIIEDCENLKNIISSGSALVKITTDKCPLIESVKLNVTNCENINIKECPKLNSVTLTTNSDFSKVNTLNLSKGVFSNILLYKIVDGSEVQINVQPQGFIDLSNFINLKEFDFQNNSNIEYIRLLNDINNPIPIKHSFQGCVNLKRIYGYFDIQYVGSTFYNLNKFSIHGDITKWKNHEITVNGVTQNPINFFEDKNIVTINDYFQEGAEVTNIKFTLSGNVNFYLTFGGTNISQFDIYYLLNVLGLSTYDKSVSITLGRQSFYSIKDDLFSYQNGNSFDRNTFFKCNKIVTINSGEASIFKTGNRVLIYSPTFTDEESNHDGLFSPMPDLKQITLFCSGSWCFDKDVFVDNPKLETLSHISTYRIQNNISNYTYNNLPPVTDLNVGDFTGIFRNNKKLLNIISIFQSLVINYNTLTLPNSLTSIMSAFNASQGKGNIVWDNIFNEESYNNLKTIANSFVVNDVVSEKVNFEIFDTMFEKMKNLANIGFIQDPIYRGGNVYFDDKNNPQSQLGEIPSQFGFRGDGLHKYFRNGIFTSNIVSQLTKLKDFVGFFAETDSPTQNFEFPGTMFENNANLENISYLFKDSEALDKLQMTSKGFSKNQNLKYVNRLFYQSPSGTGKLSQSIPLNFFYHGFNENTITYYGTNDESVKNEYNQQITDNGESSILLDQYKVIYDTPKTNIIQAMECFSGQQSIEHYQLGTNNQDITTLIEEIISENPKFYRNRRYIPFKYYTTKLNTALKTRSEQDLYTKEYDISLIQDGSKNISNLGYYCKEQNIEQNSDYYICPPDMLYYFKNNTTLCIRGMFKWCGSGTNSHHTNIRYFTGNLDGIKFKGRICPYMFDYVSSVENLQEFFQWDKGITYHKGDIIPINLFSNCDKLQYLCSTFSGLLFSDNVSTGFLKQIKYKGLKDLRGLFAASNYKNSITVNGTNFSNLSVSKISGMFSARPITISTNNYGITVSVVNGDSNTNTDTSAISKNVQFQNVITNLMNNRINTSNTGFVFYRSTNDYSNIVESNSNANVIAKNNG